MFVEPRLREIKGDCDLRYVGRTASASACDRASMRFTNSNKTKLVDDSLLKEHADEISAASEPQLAEKLAPASS
jgi:hypothetical protein